MQTSQKHERGFILLSSLIIMSLLLVLSVGLWYRSAINQQISDQGQKTTRAFYYAESAIHYVAWALASDNDAELDGEDTRDGGTDLISGGAGTVGDWSELIANTFQPGVTTVGDDGQLRYFDNRTTANRNGFFFDASNPSNLNPDLSTMISGGQMPQHLVLNIDTDGNITLASPAYSTSATPTNGAVVWLTAEDSTTGSATFGDDVQLDPDTGGACTTVDFAVACINGAQVTSYSIAAYAVAYVDGTPMRFLRALIGTID